MTTKGFHAPSRVELRFQDKTGLILLDPGPTQSAPFVDLTSRFDLGQISAEDYALGVSSALNAERSSPGIRCIVAQKAP